MSTLEEDIYTEPDFDPDTLARLGPLRAMAGTWEGSSGIDDHPVAGGSEKQSYIETYVAEPIDPQTNGPQLLYGLRYHVHIVKPGEIDTFHDQVGYWLWEPATETVVQTISIPRAQIAMAQGHAAPDAKSFTLRASADDACFGICSSTFLMKNFRTVEFSITIDLNADGSWSYEEDTIMQVAWKTEQFHHTDRNTLHLVTAPLPNPMAR